MDQGEWGLRDALTKAHQEIRSRDELIKTMRQRLEAAEKQVAWLNENLKASFDKQNFEKTEWKRFYLQFQSEKKELLAKLQHSEKVLLSERAGAEQQRKNLEAEIEKMSDQLREMTSTFLLDKSSLEQRIEEQGQRLENQEKLIKDQDEVQQDLEGQLSNQEHVLGTKEQEIQDLEKSLELSRVENEEALESLLKEHQDAINARDQEIADSLTEIQQMRVDHQGEMEVLRGLSGNCIQRAIELGSDYKLDVQKFARDKQIFETRKQYLEKEKTKVLKESESKLSEAWAAWEKSEAEKLRLTEKLDDLEQVLKEKDIQIRALRQERSEAVVLSKKLTESFNDVRDENTQLQNQQARFEERCEALRNSLEKVEEGVKQREDSRQAKLKGLQEKLAATVRELSRAEERRMGLEQRLASMIENGQQKYSGYVNEAEQLKEELQAVRAELKKELEFKETLQAGFTHLQSLNEKLVEKLGIDASVSSFPDSSADSSSAGNTYKKLKPESVDAAAKASDSAPEKNISKIRRLRT